MQFRIGRRTTTLLILSLVFVVLIITVIVFCDKSSTSNPQNKPIETESNNLDFTPAIENENSNITIPGMTGLVMKSGQFDQTIDLYNPDTNNCLFKISIFLSNNYLLYQSDYLKPGEWLTDITINQELENGIYKNCQLIYECFSLDSKTQYNGSQIRIEINATK